MARLTRFGGDRQAGGEFRRTSEDRAVAGRNRAWHFGTMAKHVADIVWTLGENEDFPKGRYSRGHEVAFDGGITVPGSASPHVVGKWAVEAAVDPEEMLVAALSTCHMLSFLHIARLAGFTVLSYRDHAEGLLEEIAPDRAAVTKVMLRPITEWRDTAPNQEKLDAMHHEAHEVCYIANSVRTVVTVETG